MGGAAPDHVDVRHSQPLQYPLHSFSQATYTKHASLKVHHIYTECILQGGHARVRVRVRVCRGMTHAWVASLLAAEPYLVDTQACPEAPRPRETDGVVRQAGRPGCGGRCADWQRTYRRCCSG